jgi:hypothetical protein
MATVKRATVAVLLCVACSKQNASPIGDGGEPDGGALDSGIAYTPDFCADGGSPFDRSETFTSASGAPVTVTICGPRPGGATATVSSTAELVSATRDGGTGTLLLAPGTYDFDGGTNWTVPNAHDLIIDGQGSTLVFHGLTTGLLISRGARLLLRNLQVDWADQLAISGTLQPASASCGGDLAFIADPAFAQDDAAPMLIGTLSEFDVARPGWPLTPYQQGHWAQTPATRPVYIGNQIWCVHTPAGLQAADAGPAVAISRVNGANALQVIQSSDVSLEHVTVYASPGEAFTFVNSLHGMRMSRCKVIRKDGRLISSSADGVNFRQTLGGILVEDSEFAHQGDDGLSIVGQFFDVAKGSTATELALSPASSFPGVVAGDTLALIDRTTLTKVGSAQVAEVSRILDGGVVMGAAVVLAGAGIPFAPDAGLLAENPLRSSPGFILRNDFLHDNDERGLLVHGENGLVEGISVANNLGMMLMAQTDFFLEGPGAANVIVRGSTFTHCDFMAQAAAAWSCAGGSASSAPPAPLSIMSLTANANYPAAVPNSHIVLQGNVIDGAPGAGLLVAGASDVTVSGNQILNANQSTLTNACGKLAVLPIGSMVATESARVTFDGNQRDGGTSLGLAIDPTCQDCASQTGY